MSEANMTLGEALDGLDDEFDADVLEQVRQAAEGIGLADTAIGELDAGHLAAVAEASDADEDAALQVLDAALGSDGSGDEVESAANIEGPLSDAPGWARMVVPLAIVAVVAVIAVISLWPSSSTNDAAPSDDGSSADDGRIRSGTTGVAVIDENGSVSFVTNGDGLESWSLWDAVGQGSVAGQVDLGGDFLTVLVEGGVKVSTLRRASADDAQLGQIAPNAIEVARAKDGATAYVVDNGNVRVWDPALPEGERSLLAWTTDNDLAPAVDVDIDGGRAVFALDNGNVRLWDSTAPEGARGSIVWGRGSERPARAVAIGGGWVGFVLDDGSVRLRSSDEDGVVAWNGADDVPALSLAMNVDGVAVMVLGNGNVRRFDPQAPRGERASSVWNAGERAAAVAADIGLDGRVAFVLDNGNVRLFDPTLPDGERSSVVWNAASDETRSATAVAVND